MDHVTSDFDCFEVTWARAPRHWCLGGGGHVTGLSQSDWCELARSRPVFIGTWILPPVVNLINAEGDL